MIVRPQILFKPERLYVDHRALDFRITDIRVGNKSQLHVAEAVPAGAFTAADGPLLRELRTHLTFRDRFARLDPDDRLRPGVLGDVGAYSRTGERIDCDTVVPALDLILRVRNDGKKPAMFEGIWFGTAIS